MFRFYFEPAPQYPPQGSRIANLFGLFDGSCWAMIFLTYLTIFYTFKLLEYIAEKMGHTYEEVEIPFISFRWFKFFQIPIFYVLYLCLVFMFQWVVIMKCIPAWNKNKNSVMRMLERQLTEVV